MTFLKGWRTVLFNVLSALMPLIDQYALGGYIPEKYMVLYLGFVISGNLVLRLLTDTRIGETKS